VTKLTFKPVTKTTLGDFESLFGAPGAPKYCWCMTWRATGDELKHTKSAERHGQMLGRIEDGVPVGLIGYAGDEPIAWVSIAPRDTFGKLGGPDASGDETIWSLTCMYAHRSVRGQGIAHQLIAAAVSHAKKHKATSIEAYPVAPDSPSYRFMGFIPAFEKAGFHQVGTAGTRRHVMRLPV
jgi:GNAT superfamily N-acetyltransferase